MGNSSVEEVNTSMYLFLLDICEHRENGLRLILGEAYSEPANPEEMPVPGCNGRIVCGDKSRLFTINWDEYISYCVRNESHIMSSDYEKYGSGHISISEISYFQDFLRNGIWFEKGFHDDNDYRVWNIYCLNHVIDIASTSDPDISVYPGTELTNLRRRS